MVLDQLAQQVIMVRRVRLALPAPLGGEDPERWRGLQVSLDRPGPSGSLELQVLMVNRGSKVSQVRGV